MTADEGDTQYVVLERRWYQHGGEDANPFPTLVDKPPSFKMLSSPIPSLELLVPSPGSTLRRSNMIAATFNLIATIVGGGVLSMPLALAKCGLVLGTLLMIFGAIITDFSLYLLCACARRTGSTSYGAVARHAFGPGLEFLTSFAILAYLLLVLCGFMVLIKGIWAPIVISILSSFWTDLVTVKHVDDVVLMVAIIATLPLFLSRDLHGLRHSCYASFASIAVLCLAMLYRAYEKNIANPNLFEDEVLFITSSVADALFAYPIIALAFVSSFNVVEVHCALVEPTRKRVRAVIHGAVFWSMMLMYVFAVAGYLNGYSATDGNILLNFDPSDPIIFLGRIGCGVCTLLAMPMSLLPCRNALLALPAQWKEWKVAAQMHDQSGAVETDKVQLLPPLQAPPNAHANEEALPLFQNPQPPVGAPVYQSTQKDRAAKDLSKGNAPSATLVGIDDFTVREKILHVTTTFAILIVCYAGAVLAPGVAIVWSICGSSLAFLVQYILPAVCFIKLRSARKTGRLRGDVLSAWGLLLLSCVGAVACTAQTVWRIFFMEKD